ncbi:protein phosphatase 2C domain-containing protein [Frisingicoccus sp.]|mgnify:FL=1|uniref:protein phosphatase 2C domain-containing protein n=1 Tax=Frisingicoccus sp. TaxID=1918627 RepID=UPI003AB89B82
MCGLWKYYSKCIKGEGHKERDMLCQDRVLYKTMDHRQAIVLVDGIGQTDTNIIAGEKVAEYAADYLLENFDEILQQKAMDIKTHILKAVRHIIKKMTDAFELPYEEFASTLMVLCIDNDSELYCGIHLGDGIMVCKDNGFKVLSYPTNGLERRQTCLTISEGAFEEMKILKGKIQGISEIILMSDGTYEYPLDKGQLLESIETLSDENAGESREDDQGIILLRRNEDAQVEKR